MKRGYYLSALFLVVAILIIISASFAISEDTTISTTNPVTTNPTTGDNGSSPKIVNPIDTLALRNQTDKIIKTDISVPEALKPILKNIFQIQNDIDMQELIVFFCFVFMLFILLISFIKFIPIFEQTWINVVVSAIILGFSALTGVLYMSFSYLYSVVKLSQLIASWGIFGVILVIVGVIIIIAAVMWISKKLEKLRAFDKIEQRADKAKTAEAIDEIKIKAAEAQSN